MHFNFSLISILNRKFCLELLLNLLFTYLTMQINMPLILRISFYTLPCIISIIIIVFNYRILLIVIIIISCLNIEHIIHLNNVIHTPVFNSIDYAIIIVRYAPICLPLSAVLLLFLIKLIT